MIAPVVHLTYCHQCHKDMACLPNRTTLSILTDEEDKPIVGIVFVLTKKPWDYSSGRAFSRVF